MVEMGIIKYFLRGSAMLLQISTGTPQSGSKFQNNIQFYFLSQLKFHFVTGAPNRKTLLVGIPVSF